LGFHLEPLLHYIFYCLSLAFNPLVGFRVEGFLYVAQPLDSLFREDLSQSFRAEFQSSLNFLAEGFGSQKFLILDVKSCQISQKKSLPSGLLFLLMPTYTLNYFCMIWTLLSTYFSNSSASLNNRYFLYRSTIIPRVSCYQFMNSFTNFMTLSSLVISVTFFMRSN
jgi:hypothetical protein